MTLKNHDKVALKTHIITKQKHEISYFNLSHNANDVMKFEM